MTKFGTDAQALYPLVIPPRDNAVMAKALTLVASRPLPDLAELLRASLVIGSALSLILAGQALPSGL